MAEHDHDANGAVRFTVLWVRHAARNNTALGQSDHHLAMMDPEGTPSATMACPLPRPVNGCLKTTDACC
jgi:hypothetical protein